MNRAQKQALAALLIHTAGTLVEFWDPDAHGNDALTDVTSEQAAEQLARWLKHLPGDSWHICLPDPDTLG